MKISYLHLRIYPEKSIGRVLAATLVWLASFAAAADDSAVKTVRLWVASTAANTGIHEWLMEDFRELHPEIAIHAKVAGALEVLEQARKGNADIVMTHHPASETISWEKGTEAGEA